ncbi:MAG: hypothetical protein GY839_02795 [candidate division Zixibacteria bacterium]|nr:hypothetical protein [candidate division Zixibacteria bacterium]
MSKSQFLKFCAPILILLVLFVHYDGLCLEADFSSAGYQGLNIGGEEAPNPFQSDGVSSDDVNTFTGNVEHGLNLVSFPGPNGFDLELGIEYSSEIEDMVYQNNDKVQSSWAGVGWSLEMPSIIADLNGTVDFIDDNYFYNSPGKGMIALIPVVTDPEHEEYMLENFRAWKIKRVFGQIEDNVQYVIGWEITREDGSVLLFGDYIDPNIPSTEGLNFDATRVSLGLGNSILTIKGGVYHPSISEVRHVAYQWDLKTVKSVNRLNNITICYEQQTKSGYYDTEDRYFTRCSHPDTIIDAIGRTVVFYTDSRQPGEYYNKMPHSNFARHDSVYLDSVVMFGCDGDWLGKYDFSYTFSNVDDDYPYDLKRYLTEISYYAYNDSTIPSMKFDYYLNPGGATPYFGALKSIRYPGGSKVEYGYEQETLEYAKIDTNVTNLSDEDDPILRTRSSEHFILKEGSNINQLLVYYWDGFWRKAVFDDVDASSWASAGNSFVFGSTDMENDTIYLYELRKGELKNINKFKCPTSDSQTRIKTKLRAGRDCYFVHVFSPTTLYRAGPHNSHFLIKHNGTWIKESNHGFDQCIDLPIDGEPFFTILAGKDYFVMQGYYDGLVADLDYEQQSRFIIAWKWNGVPGSGGVVQVLDSGSKNQDMKFRWIGSDDYFVIAKGVHDNDAGEHDPYPLGDWRSNWTQFINLYLWDPVANHWNISQVGWIADFMREGGYTQFHAGWGEIWLTAQKDFFAYAVTNRPWNSNHVDGTFCKIVNIYRNQNPCYKRITAINEVDDGYNLNVTSGPDYVAIVDSHSDDLIIQEWTGSEWSSTEIDLTISNGLSHLDVILMWSFGDYFVYGIPEEDGSLRYNMFAGYEKNIGNEDSDWNYKYIYKCNYPYPGEDDNLWFEFNGSYNQYAYYSCAGSTSERHRSRWGYGRPIKGYEADDPWAEYDDDENPDIYYSNFYIGAPTTDIYAYNYSNEKYYCTSFREFVDDDLVEATAYDSLRRNYKFDFANEDFYSNVFDYPCVSKTVYSIDDDDITGTTWNYHYYDGTTDASTQRAKYHKSVVDLPGDNGSIERYYYCGLSSTVFTDNPEFPDLTDEDLGYGLLLNGVPYKTYIIDAGDDIIDSTINFYSCSVPAHIDSTDYPTITQTYLNSTYSWADKLDIWTRFEYNSINGQVSKTKQFYQPSYSKLKTTEITFAFEADGVVYDSMEARNMLVQHYQTDVNDENIATPSSVTLRSTKVEWAEYLTPVRCFYPSEQYGWLDNEWALQNEIIEYDHLGNVINEVDALGVQTIHHYDDGGIFNTAAFVNADPLFVMYPPLVNYCAGDGDMLHGDIYTSDGITVIWDENPGKMPDGNSWEDEYGYEDPREDGILISGNAGDSIRVCHPDAEPMPFEGDYILRFDYRIKSGGINAVVGIYEIDQPINWHSSSADEDGRWHVEFLEGTWEFGSQDDELCITIICDEDNTLYLIDNIAFYPVDSRAATKKINYDKGKMIAETDDNGFSTRFVYDLYNQPMTLTDKYRQNVNSNDMFYMFESESIENFEDFEDYPNFALSTTYPNRNLLINSGFEYGKFGWKVIPRDEYFRTELYHDLDNCRLCDNPAMGAKVLIIDPPSKYADGLYSISQKTRTGIIYGDTDYTLSVNAWDPNGITTSQVILCVDWFNQIGAQCGANEEIITLADDPALCTECQHTFTSPPDAVTAEVSIKIVSLNKYYLDAYYFDQVEFIRSSEYVPSLVEISYNDGQGKNMQNVSTYNIIEAPDFVSAISYDEFFRVHKEYKPYEAVQLGHRYNPEYVDSVNEYYDDDDDYIPDCGGVAYTRYHYMNDPKGRVDFVYVPGADFTEKSSAFSYGTNTAPINGYGTNDLHRNVTIDPDGLIAVEYTNIFGQTIETTVDSIPGGLNLTTRYDANIVGDVTSVTPPLASKLEDQSDPNYGDLEIVKTFDSFGRILTDASSDYGQNTFIYDAKGQLRFSQNSEQSPDRWTETVYDVFGRVSMQGEITPQDNPPLPETVYLSWLEIGEVLRYQYDSYGVSLYEDPRKLETPTIAGFRLDTLRVRGSLLVSDNGDDNSETDAKKCFTYGNSGELLCEATFIEGLDEVCKEVYSDYDMSYQKIQQEYPEDVAGETPLLVLKYNYDERARLATIDRYLEGQADERLAEYEYFIDGAVKKCVLGDGLQKIDYYYNAPGWLAEINGTDYVDGKLTPDANDKFCMRLGYHLREEIALQDNPSGSFPLKFNGTPSWAVYHYYTSGGEEYFGNTFYYDEINRLTEAKFAFKGSMDNWYFNTLKDGIQFDYDENSNIETQVRHFTDDENYTTMTYNYSNSPYSNKLDYINPDQSPGNYDYDALGNCTQDNYRGNSVYSYNWRNLMSSSHWDGIFENELSYLDFTYEPAGKRVKKASSDLECDVDHLSLVESGPYDLCTHDDDCASLECCPFLPGDMDGDGSLIGSDLTRFVLYFRGMYSLPDTAMRMDLNCDGLIIGGDITKLVNYFKDGHGLSCCFWLEPDTTSTFYIHDAGKEATEFYKGGESVDNVCYVYGPNGRIASFNNGEGPNYYLTDHLGTTRMVIDNNGDPVADLHYLPSGDASPNYIDHSIPDVAYKFTGKELDDEGVDKIDGFNLYYFGARYYDPLSCQWKQVDPARQFPSPYSYVGGNLMRMKDEDGSSAIDYNWILKTYFEDISGISNFQMDQPNFNIPSGAMSSLMDNQISNAGSANNYPSTFKRMMFGLAPAWLFELGPEVYTFGPNSDMTSDVRDIQGLDAMRSKFYEINTVALLTGEPLTGLTRFYNIDTPEKYVNSTRTPTEFFLGSYYSSIIPSWDNKSYEVLIYNRTSMVSLLRSCQFGGEKAGEFFGLKGVGQLFNPEHYMSYYDRGSLFGGNMYQLFHWEEPIEWSPPFQLDGFDWSR